MKKTLFTKVIHADKSKYSLADMISTADRLLCGSTNLEKKKKLNGIEAICDVTETPTGYQVHGIIRLGVKFYTTWFALVLGGLGITIYSYNGAAFAIFVLAGSFPIGSCAYSLRKVVENIAESFPMTAQLSSNTSTHTSDEIKKLASLKSDGLLTDEEFQKAKAKLLAS